MKAQVFFSFYCHSHLEDIGIGSTFVWFVIFGIFQQNVIHVIAGVLEEFVVGIEDDQRDLTVTQHAQLVGFLHQTKLTLR